MTEVDKTTREYYFEMKRKETSADPSFVPWDFISQIPCDAKLIRFDDQLGDLNRFVQRYGTFQGFPRGKIARMIEGVIAYCEEAHPTWPYELAVLYTAGARKYGDWSWKDPNKGKPCSALLAACWRHLSKYEMGQEETEHAHPVSHVVCALWNLITCQYYIDHFPGDGELVDIGAMYDGMVIK